MLHLWRCSITPSPAPQLNMGAESLCRALVQGEQVHEAYRELVRPHVDSFDYFVRTGIRTAVSAIEPLRVRALSQCPMREPPVSQRYVMCLTPQQPTFWLPRNRNAVQVQLPGRDDATWEIWLEKPQVGKPVHEGEGRAHQKITPRYCRETVCTWRLHGGHGERPSRSLRCI